MTARLITRREALAVARDGAAYAWGQGTYGRLGIGPMPKLIPRLTRVQSIATRNSRSFAVLADEQIMAWGDNLKKWARPTGAPDISPFPRRLEVEGLAGK